MTYNVFSGTLNPAQSISQAHLSTLPPTAFKNLLSEISQAIICKADVSTRPKSSLTSLNWTKLN